MDAAVAEADESQHGRGVRPSHLLPPTAQLRHVHVVHLCGGRVAAPVSV